MSYKKNENQAISLSVNENLQVTVIPNEEFEFLMPTKDVTLGYGVSNSVIRVTKHRYSDELLEGKHFISAVTICNSEPKAPHNKVYWTKRGIIRLGFFIKSERAKLFRDWAEDLVINKIDKIENNQLLSKVEKTAILMGSNAKLAARIGINPSVLTHLRNSPHLVSAHMQERIEMVCNHILNNGIGVDTELVQLLIQVENKEVRNGLFNKFMGGVL
ncbi:MAG: hypothetical protein IMY72_11835 [Bacteroidetes bacterium]|nr:hypothetical protein [Bacteroidota bacterium]